MTEPPPRAPLRADPEEQLASLRRERDRLAKQIADSKQTIAESQALVERLDLLLAQLDPKR
jgi:hypothetical protein